MNSILSAALLLLSRFVFHPWNFSPVMALFMKSGKHNRLHLLVLGATLVASDLVLGFGTSLLYGYAAYLTAALVMKKWKPHWLVASVSFSILFFMLSNFGVWIEGGMYPMTGVGLMECYAAAIPFFGNTLLGNVFYAYIMFDLWERVRVLKPFARLMG